MFERGKCKMIKAATVFIVIGMIVGIWLIFPLIVGAVTLSKIEEAKSRKDVEGWAVATIFLCSLIGGLLLLNCEDDAFKKYNNE